ncbi:MAG: caspase family protein [Streptosporangiaceae bacterium]
MASARSALIIGGDDYADPGLRRLRAPASDARALAGVLQDPAIGGFEVRTLLNEPAHVVSLAVEEFFADRTADDLLLLHFSCHGVKDEDGELYFAMANTVLRRLAATAVPADFVNRRMTRSRSRRVVLLLDCCYAGAFERGMTARAGTDIGIESQFGGRGRAVITASSAMEYAFEGDVLADAAQATPSVFTSALVEGLETGDADRDQDGLVALDELYDYIYDRVRTATPNQTPGKWAFGVQGELVIARRARPVAQPAPLPPELLDAIESRLATVRLAAVQELERVLHGKHAGRALAARQALQDLTGDDSRTVAAAATATLAGEAASAGPGPAAPEPAEPAPAARRAGPVPAASTRPSRPGLLLAAAAVLSAASGIAVIRSLFLGFAASQGSAFTLADNSATLRQGLLAGSAAIIAAALLAVRPASWLAGPGLVLGLATEGPNSAIYDVLVGRAYRPAGPGLWLNAAGGLALTVAAVLAAVALARTSAVGTGSRVPVGLLPRLIIVFGALSATVLVAQVLREATIPGTSASATGRDIFPLIWSATMTLAVPLAAVVVRPRAFGIALLAGGLINDAGNAFFYSTPSNSAFAIPVAVLIGLTVTLGVTSRRRDMAAPDPPARAA